MIYHAIRLRREEDALDRIGADSMIVEMRIEGVWVQLIRAPSHFRPADVHVVDPLAIEMRVHAAVGKPAAMATVRRGP